MTHESAIVGLAFVLDPDAQRRMHVLTLLRCMAFCFIIPMTCSDKWSSGTDTSISDSGNISDILDHSEVESFMRWKRQSTKVSACVSLPDLVPDAGDFLKGFSTPTFIGRAPEHPNYRGQPINQPNTCPTDRGAYFWREPENLRAPCLWIYVRHDLGEEYIPRYIQEAECLCSECDHYLGQKCLAYRATTTVLHVEVCQNGLAVITPVKLSYKAACICTSTYNPLYARTG
ncbi:hypothetical protein Btru_039509 [Bulinus truncatus]|nr:hypothetical protein Btru_039509 [Bulinus truncatus]